MPSIGIRSLAMVGLLMFSTVGFCVAKYDVCPAERETSIQDIFGGPRYLQKSVWHKIHCPAFRAGENLDGVIWYQGSSVDDPSKVRLISRDLRGGINKDTPAEERYSMLSDLSLVIKGVEDRDQGRFLCQVIPQTTEARDAGVDVQVIGDTFPGGSSQVSSTASFQRGRRQTLPCECTSQTPDVVYWSTGEGGTTDTQIIGARFSDGATLQIQHGADYSIAGNASLTVNSLNDVHDTQRFWCHAFQSDGTLRNCDTNAKISDRQQPNEAFKASSTSFYLLEDEEQTLPCFGWTPGGTTCEVQWFKNDISDRHPLLSSNYLGADSKFELAGDFGLIIKSVGGEDAGRYQCDTGGGNSGGDINVRVIGRKFPLDGGDVYSSSRIDFEAGKNYTLTCQPASESAKIGSPATVFWSFAKQGNAMTTFIGRLNIPGSSKPMSDLGDNNCFSISAEGALLLNRCFVEDDVRYWCHVFPVNKLLMRSYVDVVIKREDVVIKHSGTIFVIIAVCCSFVLIVVVACVYRCRRKGAYLRVTMMTIETELNDLEEDVLNYVNCRKNTINLLQEAADDFEEVYKSAQGKQVVGAKTSLGGTALSFAGLGASLLTGGLSLFLTVAGAAIGVAGGAIQIGSTIAEANASKDTEKKVKKILDEDREAFAKVENRLEQIDGSFKEMNINVKAAFKTAASIYDIVKVGTLAARIGKTVGPPALKAASKIGKGMAISSILFSVISIPVDLHTVMNSSANLQNEVKPELAESIYQMIDALAMDCPSEQDMKAHMRTIRWKLKATISKKTCEMC